MNRIYRKRIFISAIIILLCIFVAMGIINKAGSSSSFITKAVNFVISPGQKFFSMLGDKYNGFIQNFADKKQIIAENEELERLNIELEDKLRDYVSTKNENDRLLKMLAFKNEHKELNLISARVIAKEPGNWFYSFTIDKGTKDGIYNNMAILSDKGVVGYVSEASLTSSLVVTIIDGGSSVGAACVRTGDTAVVDGNSALQKQGLCEMTYISSNSSITVGDVIETSGLGGIYPKGILIGKVKEISPDVHGISQTAIIEPSVDFQKITEVFAVSK